MSLLKGTLLEDFMFFPAIVAVMVFAITTVISEWYADKKHKSSIFKEGVLLGLLLGFLTGVVTAVI